MLKLLFFCQSLSTPPVQFSSVQSVDQWTASTHWPPLNALIVSIISLCNSNNLFYQFQYYLIQLRIIGIFKNQKKVFHCIESMKNWHWVFLHQTPFFNLFPLIHLVQSNDWLGHWTFTVLGIIRFASFEERSSKAHHKYWNKWLTRELPIFTLTKLVENA